MGAGYEQQEIEAAIQLTVQQLRPETEALVTRLAHNARHLTGEPAWRAYADAKRQVSAACGADAPEGEQDRAEYVAAVRAYVNLVGI